MDTPGGAVIRKLRQSPALTALGVQHVDWAESVETGARYPLITVQQIGGPLSWTHSGIAFEEYTIVVQVRHMVRGTVAPAAVAQAIGRAVDADMLSSDYLPLDGYRLLRIWAETSASFSQGREHGTAWATATQRYAVRVVRA